MLSTQDAFRKFRSRLELNRKEQEDASRRQKEVREVMDAAFEIEHEFLTGSYARWTKTKPLKDVDIFCVLAKKHRHYRDQAPSVLLGDVEKALVKRYGGAHVSQQRRSCTVDFGVTAVEDRTDYKVMSVDVVPAFTKASYYEIPDTAMSGWTETNPSIHHDKAVEAQQAYSDEWKGLVRMMKRWNNRLYPDFPKSTNTLYLYILRATLSVRPAQVDGIYVGYIRISQRAQIPYISIFYGLN